MTKQTKFAEIIANAPSHKHTKLGRLYQFKVVNVMLDIAYRAGFDAGYKAGEERFKVNLSEYVHISQAKQK